MDIHPVRFTKKQIEFLEHMISEIGFDRFEEECLDLRETIKSAGSGGNYVHQNQKI